MSVLSWSFTVVGPMDNFELCIVLHYSSLLENMEDGIEQGGAIPAPVIFRVVFYSKVHLIQHGLFDVLV